MRLQLTVEEEGRLDVSSVLEQLRDLSLVQVRSIVWEGRDKEAGQLAQSREWTSKREGDEPNVRANDPGTLQFSTISRPVPLDEDDCRVCTRDSGRALATARKLERARAEKSMDRVGG